MPSSTMLARAPLARWPYYSAYIALSGAALYYMRLSPPSVLTGKSLEPLFVSSDPFAYPGHSNIVIRRHFTGISALDPLLSMLVTAFLAGPAAFQPYIQLQQINFLFNFAPVLAVFSIEAVRSRRWAVIVFTSIWSLLYQSVGGAIIIPLYFFFHTYTFSKTDGARPVPVTWAKTLLPAIGLGYLLPTAAMYLPYPSIDYTMLATAFWQPSPLLVNLLWYILSKTSSPAGRSAPPLRRVLVVTGIVAAITHLATIYAILSSRYPTITFAPVFLPLQSTATSFEEATHYIFKVDYAIIFAATSLWCLQLQRQDAAAGKRTGSVLVDAAKVALATVVLGPGATLSWAWHGRQEDGISKRA